MEPVGSVDQHALVPVDFYQLLWRQIVMVDQRPYLYSCFKIIENVVLDHSDEVQNKIEAFNKLYSHINFASNQGKTLQKVVNSNLIKIGDQRCGRTNFYPALRIS